MSITLTKDCYSWHFQTIKNVLFACHDVMHKEFKWSILCRLESFYRPENGLYRSPSHLLLSKFYFLTLDTLQSAFTEVAIMVH
uniref:Uncharacterized protein n=1 Tax=Arundo donax TaxID=35708 RepID=A0A0A8Y489_ARUDO